MHKEQVNCIFDTDKCTDSQSNHPTPTNNHHHHHHHHHHQPHYHENNYQPKKIYTVVSELSKGTSKHATVTINKHPNNVMIDSGSEVNILLHRATQNYRLVSCLYNPMEVK